MSSTDRIARLAALAQKAGATANVLSAADVVVDPRVRLKCQVPRCPHYGVNLMCPPNVPSLREFSAALERYQRAIVLQVAIALPEAASRPDGNLAEVYESATYEQALTEASRRLASVVRGIEAEALRLGYHLAAGLTAGACRLCDTCVGVGSGKACRLAFQARPAMEAVGIDVVRTAANAGLTITFDDVRKAKWTGLVLVD